MELKCCMQKSSSCCLNIGCTDGLVLACRTVTRLTLLNVLCIVMLCVAELASCQVQQGQLQRELNQLRAMTAEKDERLADAAGGERQLRQQVEQLRQQLREAGKDAGSMMLLIDVSP
jgi:septal ring factor EnvC (AmiA/AmiB activator)